MTEPQTETCQSCQRTMMSDNAATCPVCGDVLCDGCAAEHECAGASRRRTERASERLDYALAGTSWPPPWWSEL